jgi:hypothetical protein
MTFDAFRRHLSSTHRSAVTGQPLSPHAAGDYPSRLRRLESVLQMPLENAPPMVLRSLAAELRQDSRVVATVPRKVIGDIAVALRSYAEFLDGPIDDVPNGQRTGAQPMDAKVALAELRDFGFVATPTASKKIIQLQLEDLTVYIRLDSAEPVIIHPVFEECYSNLAEPSRILHTVHLRFYHNSNLSAFPKRDNGRGFTHYGIQFGFISGAALRRFVVELQNSLGLNSPIAPEKTLQDEIREVDTESTVLSKARKGQGRFRADLLNFWQGHCPLTDVFAPELLRASHIKPWQASRDAERLDAFNGLLLAVHLDALFDRALITFQGSGEMLVSKRLSVREREAFGLTLPPRKLLLSVSHLGYLRHHQERFYAIEQKC